MDEILAEEGGDSYADNVFWGWLSLACFDVGPMIYVAADWWFYYGKLDFNGLLGVKKNPLRCAITQSIPVSIMCWAFVGVFEEYADDAAQYIWPWILHGIISIAILGFGSFVNFSGT